MSDPFSALKSISPKKPIETPPEADNAIKEIGIKRGFVEEQSIPQKKYRRKSGEAAEAQTVVSMRVSLVDWNKFVEWCDQQRMPYREAFSRLMQDIELK